MDRREALKAVSVIMGGSVIGANAFLTGCAVAPEERVNSLFLESDITLLDEIGGTIIPATDTPGAKEVGIGGFISMMVLDCYEPKDQKAFTDGLVKFKEDFKAQYGDNFEEAAPEDRLAFLNILDKEQKEYYKAGKQRGEGTEHYFKMMKELTLLGYFTSEVGCTQARRYVEVPGRYECIDYKKGDKAWAI
jgi:hypothetical protein